MFLKLDRFRLIILVLLILLPGCKNEPAFDVYPPHEKRIKIEYPAPKNFKMSSKYEQIIYNSDLLKNTKVKVSLLELKENYPSRAKFFYSSSGRLNESNLRAISVLGENSLSPNYKTVISNYSTEPLYEDFSRGLYAIVVSTEGNLEIILIESWFDKFMNYFYL